MTLAAYKKVIVLVILVKHRHIEKIKKKLCLIHRQNLLRENRDKSKLRIVWFG